MEVGLLYSGGRDSTLAARLLDGLCDVTLCCGTFGVTDDYRQARETGRQLGFETAVLELDPAVAREAVDEMVADGYPRAGIQQVHEHALERAAGKWPTVADGTRRDDRAPTVDRPVAQSLEDRFGVAYLAPLAGIGRGAVDRLAEEYLAVETGPSEELSTGDYEAELRALVRAEHGQATVEAVFPEHVQSRVTGWAVGGADRDRE
jgi:predicted subunit of tRNA(5-methylaminomethyl-2-thiouridylate) methyltransferase